jgi:uncharacterized protein (DUF58 family)
VADEPILRGAYVELGDLLKLRYRRQLTGGHSSRVMGSQAGNRLSKLRGRGIDFSEVRAYQPGDDVRTIDWRVTARKNKPHTKVFREERERLTLVVVDQSQSMFFGSQVRLKSVAAAELAALGVWQALNHNDRVGGMIIGNETYAAHKPYRNVNSVARFLGDLARMNQLLDRGHRHPSANHFAEALSQIRRLARSNYRIYFISDFQPIGEHWRDAFRSLSQRNEVIALKIFDPLERQLPPSDSYTVTDGDNRWQFHAGNPQLRKQYEAHFDSHEERFKKICDQTLVEYRSIPTDLPLSRVPGWY